MKITLWQQFSSNHSGRFEIVGKFSNEQEAEKAAIEIRKILADYVAWLKANPKADVYSWVDNDEDMGFYELPPPIQAVTEHYNFRWPEYCEIDWIGVGNDNLDEFVIVWKNNLFLSSGMLETWRLPSGFTPILKQLGASTFESHLEYGDLRRVEVSVVCYAPGTELAESISHALFEYFKRNKTIWGASTLAPWGHFVHGEIHPKAALIQEHAEIDYEVRKIKERTYEARKTEQEAAVTLEQQNKILAEIRDEIAKVTAHLPVFTRVELDLFRRIWSLTFADLEPDNIHLESKILKLEKLDFYDHTYSGLPALVAWLESYGCTVDYSFTEVLPNQDAK